MECYCYETEADFVYCVKNAEGKIHEKLQVDQWWKKVDDKFLKIYPNIPEEKEIIKSNFAQFGESWLEGIFDWKNVLLLLSQKLTKNEIEWYIIGSVSEAVLGVDVKPHDIDIIVHTRDFYKVRDLFLEYVIEPFVDNKGTWLVQYFGKLYIDGASIDIAADDKMNMENLQHRYEKTKWNGYDVFIEPLQIRYEVEKQRDRKNRIKAIEEYMNHTE